jgi:ribonuclease BN (tRNA processing enzyme)
MRLAFLGTGAAFSLERYNGAVAVDGRLLLDAGAPILPHLHRLGIDPGGIQAVFLTHFHGDHVLGLPPFLLQRAFAPSAPLTIVGPAGVEQRVDRLMRLAWGDDWRTSHPVELTYEEDRPAGEVAGVPYEAIPLVHAGLTCRGYRLRIDGRTLAYAGDTTAGPELDELLRGADIAITEATGPNPGPDHTSWAEAETLAARHASTRFLFNHLYEGTVPGAVGDLQTLDI